MCEFELIQASNRIFKNKKYEISWFENNLLINFVSF
jgi:hypothetical protein